MLIPVNFDGSYYTSLKMLATTTYLLSLWIKNNSRILDSRVKGKYGVFDSGILFLITFQQ
jgi:hypothetical protein